MDKTEYIIFLTAGAGYVMLVSVLLYFILQNQLRIARYQFEIKEKELMLEREVETAIFKGESKERKRIALELHDGLGSRLTAIKMDLESGKDWHLYAKDDIQFLIAQIDLAIVEVREVSHNMQPGFIEQNGLTIALRKLVDMLNHRGKTRVELMITTDADTIMGRGISVQIYRMVSELLNNVLKHSQAQHAYVQLNAMEGMIRLTVEDDGVGLQNTLKNKGSKGMGMDNLRNRVSMLAGEMHVDSSEQGTIISIEFSNTVNRHQYFFHG